MGQEKSQITDFTEGNIPQMLAAFAWPMLLANLLQVLYNIVDMLIVGRVLGKTGVSAVAVGGDVTNFLTFLIMGFSSAGQIIISRYVGKNERDQIGPFVGIMGAVTVLSSMVISIFGYLFRYPILRLMNTPTDVFEGALSYTVVCLIGLVFIYGYNTVSAILRGMGDSRHPLLFVAIAAFLNFFLDLFFVAKCNMGPEGAALATVISQAVSFLSCLVFLIVHHREFELNIGINNFLCWNREMFVELIAIGVPMAIKTASIQASKLFVNAWINSYGVAVSAFTGIAHRVSNVSWIISHAMTIAGSSMIGQNYAAEKHERVHQIVKWIAWITICCSSLLSILIVMWPYQIFGLFIVNGDKDVLGLSGVYVPIAVLMFYGSALRSIMTAFINGSGNRRVISVAALLDGIVVRLGLAIFLGLILDMKYVGFWLADALAGFTPFLIGIVYYSRYLRKHRLK